MLSRQVNGTRRQRRQEITDAHSEEDLRATSPLTQCAEAKYFSADFDKVQF